MISKFSKWLMITAIYCIQRLSESITILRYSYTYLYIYIYKSGLLKIYPSHILKNYINSSTKNRLCSFHFYMENCVALYSHIYIHTYQLIHLMSMLSTSLNSINSYRKSRKLLLNCAPPLATNLCRSSFGATFMHSFLYKETFKIYSQTQWNFS